MVNEIINIKEKNLKPPMFFIFSCLDLILSAISYPLYPKGIQPITGNEATNPINYSNEQYPEEYTGDMDQYVNTYGASYANDQMIPYIICNTCSSNLFWNLNNTSYANNQTPTNLQCYSCRKIQTWPPSNNLDSENIQQGVFLGNNQTDMNSVSYLYGNVNPIYNPSNLYPINNGPSNIISITGTNVNYPIGSPIFFKPGPNPNYFNPMGIAVNDLDRVSLDIYKGMEEFIKLDWHNTINDIKTKNNEHFQYFNNNIQYIDRQLSELMPLKIGILLYSTKWTNLKDYKDKIVKHNLNYLRDDILIYTDESH